MVQVTTENGGATPAPVESAPAIATDLGSLFEILTQGGYLMIPLVVCSVLVLAYFVERLVGLRRGRVVPGKLVRALNDAAERGDVAEVRQLCESSKSAFASVA